MCKRESFQRVKTRARTRIGTLAHIVGLWVTRWTDAIIRRARRVMLMNIDVPRRYVSLEVNALALLTLGASSRAARHDERENIRS